MNQKMSYSRQQELKKTIAGRLKAASQQQKREQTQTPQIHDVSPQEHIMPDGMNCMDIRQREEKVSCDDISGRRLKEALVLSEILAEPVCKRRHNRKRIIC